MTPRIGVPRNPIGELPPPGTVIPAEAGIPATRLSPAAAPDCQEQSLQDWTKPPAEERQSEREADETEPMDEISKTSEAGPVDDYG